MGAPPSPRFLPPSWAPPLWRPGEQGRVEQSSVPARWATRTARARSPHKHIYHVRTPGGAGLSGRQACYSTHSGVWFDSQLGGPRPHMSPRGVRCGRGSPRLGPGWARPPRLLLSRFIFPPRPRCRAATLLAAAAPSNSDTPRPQPVTSLPPASAILYHRRNCIEKHGKSHLFFFLFPHWKKDWPCLA